MPSLLGIDSGLTVTKAVIFDVDGTTLAVARRRVPQYFPKPRHVERDMDEFWNATADAIAEAIEKVDARHRIFWRLPPLRMAMAFICLTKIHDRLAKVSCRLIAVPLM